MKLQGGEIWGFTTAILRGSTEKSDEGFIPMAVSYLNGLPKLSFAFKDNRSVNTVEKF